MSQLDAQHEFLTGKHLLMFRLFIGQAGHVARNQLISATCGLPHSHYLITAMSPLLPSVNELGAESNPDLGWTVLPITAMLPQELWENCSRQEVHQTSFLLTNNLSSFLAFVGILMTSTLHRELPLFFFSQHEHKMAGNPKK